MKENKVKALLKQGKPVMVPEINQIFSPRIIEILGILGFESVWIDMEHSDLTYDCLSGLCRTVCSKNMDVIVRIARNDYSSVVKLLEMGVNGLVLPHCLGAEDARRFVRMAKFAPLGLRGIGAGADSDYGIADISNFVKAANKETLLAVMIEDKEAIDEADNIAAVEGIDVLFIGPGDLTHSYGILGQTEHPLIRKAMGKVDDVCKKHKKAWGSIAEPGGRIERLLGLGAQFINITSEMSVLTEGFRLAKESFTIQVASFNSKTKEKDEERN